MVIKLKYIALLYLTKKSLSIQSLIEIVCLHSQKALISIYLRLNSDQLKTRNKVRSSYNKQQSILASNNMVNNTEILSYNNMQFAYFSLLHLINLLRQCKANKYNKLFTLYQWGYNSNIISKDASITSWKINEIIYDSSTNNIIILQ